MDSFLDIDQVSLNKRGEELCGDQVRVIKSPEATTLILSDGLGSGVKANILATLTASIIATMLREAVDLREVIDTVIRTLPVDPERGIAYATFSILTIDHETCAFRAVNYDNPPPFFIRAQRAEKLAMRRVEILGKTIAVASGTLEMGGFIGLISDGVLHAAEGNRMDLGWGWEQVAAHLQETFARPVYSAHSAVNSVMALTNRAYHYLPGDDATFVGVLRRRRNTLAVFTGPPLDNGYDYVPVFRLLEFEGRKVVCGGTTANIVASYLKTQVETDMSSLTDTSPAIGRLPGIDLVTEGVITLAGALEALEQSQGRLDQVPPAHTGVALLARELLGADAVTFLVGQAVNPAQHNPLLPRNTSIRRYLVSRIAETLTRFHKDVTVETY